MADDDDFIPFGLAEDLKSAMRRAPIKKGKGKKARSLIEQLLDLFDWGSE